MSQEVRMARPDLKAFLEKHIDSVQRVAAATLNPERMTRLVCAAATRDEKLASCTPMSILRSLAQAASMGMEPFDGRNEVHLVPRWNSKGNGGSGCMEATCLVGYPGLIRLATDTGKVNYMDAQVVHEKDDFDYALGDDPFVKHKPTLAKDRGGKIAVYAVAKLATGEKKIEIIPWHEIEAIRDRSKDGKGSFSPWKTDESEMGRKTGIRRLSKYLPKSQALVRALEVQAKTEAGDYFDGEVIRPGDANIPEIGSSKFDGAWEWSEEDKQVFLNACGDLQEACIAAGLSETETNKKLELYHEQKRAGVDSPDKVIQRIYQNCDRLNKKETATDEPA